MSSNFEYRYLSISPEQDTTGSPKAFTYGNDSAAGTTIYGEVDDESFAHMFDLLTRADMSRYGAAKSVNGKEYSEGGLNMVMQPDSFLLMLLYGIYGDNDDLTSTATSYDAPSQTYSFKEANDHILPSFTLKVGREDNMHTYTGMVMSRLSVSATVGEYATISADFNGKAESPIDSLVTPSFSGASVDGFHFAEGIVSFSETGVSTTVSSLVKSISFEVNTNLNTDDACSIGSQTYTRKPEPQMREITGSVEFSRPVMSDGVSPFTNEPDYTDLIVSGGALYDGTTASPAISLSFLNGGGDQFTFEIRKCRWEAPSLNVSGRDSSTMTVNFVALVDTADNVMTEASLNLQTITPLGAINTL